MLRVAVLAVGIATAAAVAFGQAPVPRGGGLLPGRDAAPPAPSSSREELARRWDLNADGQIDEVEAETARSKMRRDRLELLQRGQSSRAKPLTKTVTNPVAETSETEDLVLPDPAPDTMEKKKTTEKPASDPPKSLSAAREPPPPAKKDLNAGRLPAGLPPVRGIVPGAMPPGRAGTGPTTPPTSGSKAARPPTIRPPIGRATRPAPTIPARPRVSAEDIGGP